MMTLIKKITQAWILFWMILFSSGAILLAASWIAAGVIHAFTPNHSTDQRGEYANYDRTAHR